MSASAGSPPAPTWCWRWAAAGATPTCRRPCRSAASTRRLSRRYRTLKASRRSGSGGSSGRVRLLELDTGALDESLPALDFGADGGHEGLRRAAHGDDAILGKPSRHFRALQHGVELRIHARDDLAGNTLGADHAVPQVEIERRIALLAVGWDVRRRREPLRRADGKPAQLAALDIGQHGRGAAGQDLQI